ncbi:MAG: hypothetical protein ACRD1T_19550 [Acidimicrobiia bacterium]
MSNIRNVGFATGLVLCLVGSSATTVQAVPVLSGLIAFGATDAGSADGRGVWNTLGGDEHFNLWIARGLTAPFINGPTDALAGISLDLPDGIHTFTLFADPRAPGSPYFGLNFFFDGDNMNPGISVYGTESPTRFFVFFPSSGMTLTLAAASVPGSGTLSFLSGSTSVTLTDFSWNAGLSDRVSPFTATPNGFPDYIGQFTVRVETIPEPGTLVLCTLGIVRLFRWHSRRGSV